MTASDGRHARGTWTPRVTPGSGGRRYLREEPPEPPTALVASTAASATTVPSAPTSPSSPSTRSRTRTPIRYAPVPGAPRRPSFAVWGPPRPAGA